MPQITESEIRARQIATELVSSIGAVRAVVEAFAQGKLIPIVDEHTPLTQRRSAPFFERGRIIPGNVQFSTRDVAVALGATIPSSAKHAHRFIRCAIDILEAIEEGLIPADTLEKIANAEPGFRVNSLNKTIRAAPLSLRVLFWVPSRRDLTSLKAGPIPEGFD